MTTTLTKLPGLKWWIETDDTTGEIVGTYNKTDIISQIQVLRDTLSQLPTITTEATDIDSLLSLITNSTWGSGKKSRITTLVNTLWLARQGDPRMLEVARIQAEIDVLVALRDRLV